jgi:hypothetical protein
MHWPAKTTQVGFGVDDWDVDKPPAKCLAVAVASISAMARPLRDLHPF